MRTDLCLRMHRGQPHGSMRCRQQALLTHTRLFAAAVHMLSSHGMPPCGMNWLMPLNSQETVLVVDHAKQMAITPQGRWRGVPRRQ